VKNLNLTIDEWLTVQGALRNAISRCRMHAEDALEMGFVGPNSNHEFWTQRMRYTRSALRKLEQRSSDIWTPDLED
jgi:hypothetical protein